MHTTVLARMVDDGDIFMTCFVSVFRNELPNICTQWLERMNSCIGTIVPSTHREQQLEMLVAEACINAHELAESQHRRSLQPHIAVFLGIATDSQNHRCQLRQQ